MLLGYILFFFAGVFVSNGIPQFIKGITGEWHMTPFVNPSGPIVSMLWGLLNLVAGYLLFVTALDQQYRSAPDTAAFIMGVLITSLLLAAFWEDNDRARGRDQRPR